jgi:uncharacterized protein
LQEFDKAVELKADYAEAYASRADILRQRARDASESESQILYERALADYSKAIDLGSQHEEWAFRDRSFVNYYLHHLDAAIEDFTKAIELAPELRLYMGRAIAYADGGDFARATADVDKAATLINAPSAATALEGVREYIAQRRRRSPQEAGNIAKVHLAADRGDAEAQFTLGVAYRDGSGVPQDEAQAVQWFRKAAEQGLAVAEYNLALMYAKGTGVSKNPKEAALWYEKAAQQGDARAQSNLGTAYQVGDGVPQDVATALRLYRQAAEQGNAVAQSNLGVLYQTGNGVVQNSSQAVQWYRKAAEQGYMLGQFNLGMAYMSGRGVNKDSAEAIKWIRSAAEQNLPSAQFSMGLAYGSVDGFPKDDAQAAIWYRKAAEQGDSRAQTLLASQYLEGVGVLKNVEEGLRWLRAAADQKEFLAMFKVGTLYANGTNGIQQDSVEAYKWLSLAVAASPTPPNQKQAADARDALAKKMTRAQIAEAETQVREWTAAFDRRK